MSASQRAGSRHEVHIALCDRDDCAWKHRGVTAQGTTEAAQAHSRTAGHPVSLYEDHEKVGGTMPPRAERRSDDAVSKPTVEQLQKEIETWRELHAIDVRRANEAVTENIRLRSALREIASGYRDVSVATTEPLFRLTRKRMMRVAKDAMA